MKQSLPAIIAISTVPCEHLAPNIEQKYMAHLPIGIFPLPTAVEHFGNASCEAEQEYDNGYYSEKTVLQFTTTDEIDNATPIAFVITDANGQSYIIGTKEAPFPMVEITRQVDKETNIYSVKVTFHKRKSLIPCTI